MIKKILNNQGIGLVEAVIAIGFVIALIVALLGLTTFNVQNATNVNSRQESVKKTSLVLENLRSQKDANYDNFYNFLSSTCYYQSALDIQGVCSFNDDFSTINKSNPCPATDGTVCFSVYTEPATINYSGSGTVVEGSEKSIFINIVSFYEVNKNIFSSATSTVFTNWRTRQ